MTLAEFENKCLNGSLGSITPVDEIAALNRVQALAARYRDRLEKHSAQWKLKKAKRKAGIEHSLPKGDRD